MQIIMNDGWENKTKVEMNKPSHHKTLEERAMEFGGELHLDGEFDWGEPEGREIW